LEILEKTFSPAGVHQWVLGTTNSFPKPLCPICPLSQRRTTTKIDKGASILRLVCAVIASGIDENFPFETLQKVEFSVDGTVSLARDSMEKAGSVRIKALKNCNSLIISAK
jgi:hypothetical protein